MALDFNWGRVGPAKRVFMPLYHQVSCNPGTTWVDIPVPPGVYDLYDSYIARPAPPNLSWTVSRFSYFGPEIGYQTMRGTAGTPDTVINLINGITLCDAGIMRFSILHTEADPFVVTFRCLLEWLGPVCVPVEQ